MNTTVKEVLAGYEVGDFTLRELYSKVFRELTVDSADAIIAMLPPDLRRGFADWARELFDDDTPASGFFTIHGPPVTDEALSAVRDWLRRHPKEDQV